MTFKARLIAAALLATGCSAGDTSEDPMVTAAEAISDAQTSEIPAGMLEFLAGPPMDDRRWEHEGLHCDTTPERTTVEVCGKSFPAELHLEWTDCQTRPRMHRGPGQGPQGQVTAQGGEQGPGQPAPVLSTGTLEVSSTLEPVGECGETPTIRHQKQSTHSIRHTAPDGTVKELSGTVTSVSVRGPEAAPHTRSSTFDTTRTLLDAEGNTLESLHMAGTLEVNSDRSGEAPKHTSKGTLTVTPSEGSTATMTLTDIVRAPPPQCAWPISGTLQRAEADGTTHVLSFGPECGQATLDGEAITLPSRPHHARGPGGRGDGAGRPPPPGGM